MAIARLPLHARNLEVAQTVLGSACAEISFTEFRDRPLIDDREFFVSAWCHHPKLIHEEQIIFIPEPRVPGIAPPDSHLPGLRYLVRTRLVAYQDWSTPPASPRDGGHDDGDFGGDGGHDANNPRNGPQRRTRDGADGPSDGEVDDASMADQSAGAPLGGSVRVGSVCCPLRQVPLPSTFDSCGKKLDSAETPARLDKAFDRWQPTPPSPPIFTPGRPVVLPAGAPEGVCCGNLIALSPELQVDRRRGSSPVGFVNGFLNTAPVVLHRGYNILSPQQCAYVDWWPEVALADSSVPLALSPSRSVDWWADMAEIELGPRVLSGLPQQRGAPPIPSAAPVPSSPFVGSSPARRGAEDFESSVCIPLQTPILKAPLLRRARMPAAPSVLRRSGRLAAKPRAANATRLAQLLLLKKMGIRVDVKAPDADVKARFRALIRGDLPEKKKDMLMSLLRGNVDFSAVELELDGLDEDDA